MEFTWTTEHVINVYVEELFEEFKSEIEYYAAYYRARNRNIEMVIEEIVSSHLSGFDDDIYYNIPHEIYEQCEKLLSENYIDRITKMLKDCSF
jgi:hypothetical protein